MNQNAVSVKTENIIKKESIKHETSLVSDAVVEVVGKFGQVITSENAGQIQVQPKQPSSPVQPLEIIRHPQSEKGSDSSNALSAKEDAQPARGFQIQVKGLSADVEREQFPEVFSNKNPILAIVFEDDQFIFLRKDESEKIKAIDSKKKIERKAIVTLNLYQDHNNKLIGIEAESQEYGINKLLGTKGNEEEWEDARSFDLTGHEIIGCEWDKGMPEYTNFEFKFASKK